MIFYILQVAARYHVKVFREWKRVHQVVTLVVTSQSCDVQPPPETSHLNNTQQTCDIAHRDVRSSKVFSRDVYLTLSLTMPIQRSKLFASSDACSGQAQLYSKSFADGRWSIGGLLATSVSDTAIASLHALLPEKNQDLTSANQSSRGLPVTGSISLIPI